MVGVNSSTHPFIDARCGCAKCEERTQNVYRQVGWCSNCGAEGIVVLYRAGDSVRDLDCPVCEHVYSVRSTSQRLATPDEVPYA